MQKLREKREKETKTRRNSAKSVDNSMRTTLCQLLAKSIFKWFT